MEDNIKMNLTGVNLLRLSSRIKYYLDVTCYFISLLMCSTCFGL